MDRTTIQEKTLYMGELDFTGILKSLIKGYKYTHKGEKPEGIVIPRVDMVDGVPIAYGEGAEPTFTELELEEG